MEFPEFKKLAGVIAQLRHPERGCPWDLKQTHKSLLRYLVEESYEYIHAVEKGDEAQMEEELGDVLLQVLLHSQIASESGRFNLESVSKKLADKMIERHPHVFAKDRSSVSAQEVSKNWEELKRKKSRRAFKEEDAYMPSLMAAEKIGKKSALVHFDWDTVEQVFAKVEEELNEVREELEAPDRNLDKLREEIGDLLFSAAQLARHLEIPPEEALREANLKFIGRFSRMEDKALEQGLEMERLNVDELEELWQTIKKEGRS